MNEIGIFSQVGVGIATLIILYVVVKYFTQSSDKKDQQIRDLTDNHYKQVFDLTNKNQTMALEFAQRVQQITNEFANTINNYIRHDEQIRLEQTKRLENVTDELKRLHTSNKDIANAFGKQAAVNEQILKFMEAKMGGKHE